MGKLPMILTIATLALGGCGGDAVHAVTASLADTTRDFNQEYGSAGFGTLMRGSKGVLHIDPYRQVINGLEEQGLISAQERDERNSKLLAYYDQFRQGRLTQAQFDERARTLTEASGASERQSSERQSNSARKSGADAQVVPGAGMLRRVHAWNDRRPGIAEFNARTREINRVISDYSDVGYREEYTTDFIDKVGKTRNFTLVQITRTLGEKVRNTGAEEFNLDVSVALHIDGKAVETARFDHERPNYTLAHADIVVVVDGTKVNWRLP